MSRKRRKHRGGGAPASPEQRQGVPATGAPVATQPKTATRDPRPKRPEAREDIEPVAARRPVPAWIFALLAFLIYVGDVYVWNNGGDVMGKTGWFPTQVYDPYMTHSALVAANPATEGDLHGKGQLVFERNCQQCHQATGLGVPGQFPPLAGSEWVLAEGPNRIIRVVLNGFGGPVTVKGQPFNNNMFAFRDLLSDEEIAAVLTFVRSEWGNSASPVNPEQVKKIREATASRSMPWSETELLKLPVQD